MLPDEAVRILEKALGHPNVMRNEALFFCPFCSHHKPKMSVNMRSFFWKCWVCDSKGRSLFSLLRKIGNQKYINLYRQAYPDHYQPEKETIPEDFSVFLPDEYIPLAADRTSFHAKRALRYLESRSVNFESIVHHKIGFAPTGRYADRIILPSFAKNGEVNFFTARTIFKNDPFKYLNPETPGGYRGTIVFNELNIDYTKPIFLVEGFFDMLRFDKNVVPLFGSTLSETSRLFLEIVNHEAEIFVCLDSDAKQKQFKILASLFSHGICCHDVDLGGKKDFSDMSENEIQESINGSSQASKEFILKERIRTISLGNSVPS